MRIEFLSHICKNDSFINKVICDNQNRYPYLIFEICLWHRTYVAGVATCGHFKCFSYQWILVFKKHHWHLTFIQLHYEGETFFTITKCNRAHLYILYVTHYIWKNPLKIHLAACFHWTRAHVMYANGGWRIIFLAWCCFDLFPQRERSFAAIPLNSQEHTFCTPSWWCLAHFVVLTDTAWTLNTV